MRRGAFARAGALPARRRGGLPALLAAIGILLACGLACCAPEPACAAPSSISGTCYVECLNPEVDGAAGGNRFRVGFPQYGVEAEGVCTSGPLYGTPVPGHYPFTGTRGADGGYRIAIDCSGAAMYPNHYSPHGAQDVGGFSLWLYGDVEVVKHAPEGYAQAVPEATLAGARYQVEAADGSVVAEMATDADGRAVAADVPIGKYVLREVEPPRGYGLDGGPQALAVAGGAAVRADSWEAPLRGSIELVKGSAAPDVGGGSPCYSLAGAVYGVYADAACTDEVTRVATGGDGAGRCAAELWPGTYWVKEIAPPPGFSLDGRACPVVLSIDDCRAGAAALAQVADMPQLAPVEEAVRKLDAETGLAEPQGDATLAGAEFTFEHYAGSFDTIEQIEAADAGPTLVLRAATGEDGVARLDAAGLPDAGAGPGLPLGTVVVRETRPPEGYLLPERAAVVVPVKAKGTDPLDGVFAAPEVADQVIRGDIEIVKTGAGAGALPGVAFDVVHKASGRTVARLVTDEEGLATTARPDEPGALPYGTYLVREDPSTTPEGFLPAPEIAVDVTEHGRAYRLDVENKAVPAAPGEANAVETGDPARAPAALATVLAVSALAATLAARSRMRTCLNNYK